MKHKFLISLIVGAFLVACSPTSASTIVIKGKGVAVTVPDTYVSENPEIALDFLGVPELSLLYAYDTKQGPTEIVTNFSIVKAPPSSVAKKVPLESLIPSLIKDCESVGATDIEIKDCVYSNSECVAIAYTLTQESKTMRCLQYWVKEGADVYGLTFGTHISEFPRRYDEFSQIFSSFQILE